MIYNGTKQLEVMITKDTAALLGITHTGLLMTLLLCI